jgi:hypothetical protein
MLLRGLVVQCCCEGLSFNAVARACRSRLLRLSFLQVMLSVVVAVGRQELLEELGMAVDSDSDGGGGAKGKKGKGKKGALAAAMTSEEVTLRAQLKGLLAQVIL